MKTLYLDGFCRSALKAMGKNADSLSDDVTGDDLRAMAKMLDVAEKRKAKKEKLTPAA